MEMIFSTEFRYSRHDVHYYMMILYQKLPCLQINRDVASLIVLLAIKPSYPDSAPVFCLNLHWRGEHNQANSERVRQLESMLNRGLSKLGGGDDDDGPGNRDSCCWDLLNVQLLRLLASLDVMLEAWDAMDGNGGKDFPREKLFFRPVRYWCNRLQQATAV